MERTFKHFFWHPHETDEYPKYDRMIPNFGNPHSCGGCARPIKDELGFFGCQICHDEWHLGCIPSSPDDINHPFHPYHPLKLQTDGPLHYSNGKCAACKRKLETLFYHCSVCDFNLHMKCAKNPPPLIVDAPKCHKHTLTLMARDDTFTCNACGTHGERCPYVCAPCALMFHRDCITLPHVININRHDHRISHTYTLGFGSRKCPICHKKIDWRYGAYSCSTCPNYNYVVHSKCATRKDVWDGVELEGVPEEFVDVAPFKEIAEGVINHFSHVEHNLRINNVDDEVATSIDRDESVRCEACVHPIYDDQKHYSCMECNYLLHETCANLPLQKRNGFSTKPLSLKAKKHEFNDFLTCVACGLIYNGFRYEGRGKHLDVRCASISWYCDYECHPHTLFLTTLTKGTCRGCNLSWRYVLHCVECDFCLCFECATLPKKIKHKCDKHFLSLRYVEKASGKYWCEVCETLLDPQQWFYTCDDCGVTLHIKCALGEFRNAVPGVVSVYGGEKKLELVSNGGGMLRPKCATCGSRCLPPLIIKHYFKDSNGGYYCSIKCQDNDR